MNPRLPFDDAAWEKSDQIEDSWLDLLFDEDIYNEIGIFLAEHHCLANGLISNSSNPAVSTLAFS